MEQRKIVLEPRIMVMIHHENGKLTEGDILGMAYDAKGPLYKIKERKTGKYYWLRIGEFDFVGAWTKIHGSYVEDIE